MKKIFLILIVSTICSSAFANPSLGNNGVEFSNFLLKPASFGLIEQRVPGPVNCFISCDQQLRYCLMGTISDTNLCHYQYKQCLIICGE